MKPFENKNGGDDDGGLQLVKKGRGRPRKAGRGRPAQTMGTATHHRLNHSSPESTHHILLRVWNSCIADVSSDGWPVLHDLDVSV